MTYISLKFCKLVSFYRTFNSSSFDHSMAAANDDYTCSILSQQVERKKKQKVLRDGLKILRRAPPPHTTHLEEKVKLIIEDQHLNFIKQMSCLKLIFKAALRLVSPTIMCFVSKAYYQL